MKKITLLAFAAVVMTFMGCLPAMAQVHVTFTTSSSFYAENAKMPPGTYTIRQMQDEPAIQILQNSSGSHTVMLDSQPSSKASKGTPEILFNRYGTMDYLEAVETSNGTSIDFPTTSAEKVAAKKDTAKPHTVPAK